MKMRLYFSDFTKLVEPHPTGNILDDNLLQWVGVGAIPRIPRSCCRVHEADQVTADGPVVGQVPRLACSGVSADAKGEVAASWKWRLF